MAALIWFLPSVRPPMYIKIPFPCESFVAIAALIRHLPVWFLICIPSFFWRKSFNNNCIDKFSPQYVSSSVYQEYLSLWNTCNNGCSDKVSLQCDSSCVFQDSIKITIFLKQDSVSSRTIYNTKANTKFLNQWQTLPVLDFCIIFYIYLYLIKHWKGFSTVWVFMCISKFLFFEKAFSQWLQL